MHPPDLAFIRQERLPCEAEWDGLCLVPPDLGVEVTSPVDDEEAIGAEARAYLAGGVPLLWVADPWRRVVAVRAPKQPRRLLGEGDDLDGDDVLPGFRLSVGELFR